ncbi:MAG TPA: hybrid sensor histidine kinase/response regulator [Caulobacteraceae bacterium]|nr:hybrid sensor histidine kinase/response regulator [Caulobacteraceae bacterium]
MSFATVDSSASSKTDRVAAGRVRVVYRNVPVGVLGALFGVAVLSWVLIYTDPHSAKRVGLWFGFTVVVAIWQLVLWRLYWRAKPADSDWRIWAGWFCAASFVEGCRWGLGELWLAAPGNMDQELWVLLVACSASASSVSSLGSYTPAFYLLLAPATVPIAIWSAFQGDAQHWAIAVLDIVFATAVSLLGAEQSRSLAEALRLRFENLDLAEDLRVQKDRAEVASAAKTSFMAAASHDLRQPLHAIGMFLGALDSRRMDAGARVLTRQIAESVGAMNGLFDALLDVSQLDAGVVRARPTAFPIQPLLERICREQAPELDAKGLAIALHPCSLSVEADGVLLEQIIRNVVSNAVRYTEQGRVVVGCRRGERLSIEIWDTGPGIPEEHQARVFEEFFQVGNPERDRAKGLGLGLAITKRMANLIACPIQLISTPGKGVRFTISVPIASNAAAAELQRTATIAPTARGLIAVVDDEVAIQQAMRSLLGEWGYDVVAAGSGAALIEGLRGHQPRLLICDWRLRDRETAMTVIARVRARFGEDLPILLITGDTAPEQIREAHATGLLLLHKPVQGGKLRAAIGNLLRDRAEAAE